jgi:DNA-binding transcriptional regulator LsrR (DeoR family)
MKERLTRLYIVQELSVREVGAEMGISEASVRRRLTAREILALSLKISETQEIEKRLERLEEILEARTPRA